MKPHMMDSPRPRFVGGYGLDAPLANKKYLCTPCEIGAVVPMSIPVRKLRRSLRMRRLPRWMGMGMWDVG